MAFDTRVAAADTVAATPPDVAGLYTSSLISPRCLLPAGRSSGRETGPDGSCRLRWGVTASGVAEATSDSRLAPLTRAGVVAAAAPSAGRKRTLIFFSWIDDLLVCSMCDHYNLFSPASCLYRSPTYQRSDVGKFFVGSDENRLHEELVTALGVWRWVFLHGLEENYANVLVCCHYRETFAEGGWWRTLHFDILARLNAPAVWPHAVSRSSSSAAAREPRL
jgi:hypothetical protein